MHGSVLRIRIRNPDQDPSDPYVCGPPGSGSGSFYHQAKIVRKTLIPTALWLLFDFLSLKNYVNVPSKRSEQKNFFEKLVFLASWRSMTKIAGSGSINQRHGSADPDPDPDPHQNVMDPQDWHGFYYVFQACCISLQHPLPLFLCGLIFFY